MEEDQMMIDDLNQETRIAYYDRLKKSWKQSIKPVDASFESPPEEKQ